MDVYCPECRSRKFVPFNGEYLCCNCSRTFGPKCPECGTEMDPHGRTWVCSVCRHEVEFSEIDLPNVESEVYLRAFRNAKSKKSTSSGGSSQSFFGFLWDELCDGITEWWNSANKK